MRILPLAILVSTILLTAQPANATATEFYLHRGTCVGYASPCVLFNENTTLQSTAASYAMNQASPIVYLGLVPSVSATGLTMSGGNFTLHLWISSFTIDPTIDPSFVNIRMNRGSGELVNQTFIFTPSFGENQFALANVPSSTDTHTLYLELNMTGSSITSLTFNYDSQDSPSRLSTQGFRFTGVTVFEFGWLFGLMVIAILLSSLRLRLSKRF